MRQKALFGSFAEIWCLLSLSPTDTTDFCGQGVGNTRQSKLISWQLRKSIRSIGYVCGQEVATSRREKRAVFRAELSQNKYLIYASLIQVQLPDPRIGKENVTCCAPVLVELDRELRSRSEAYLLTHLLLTSLQLPGCRPGYFSQNMHSYCRWLWWRRTSGSFYSHPHQGITHHCFGMRHLFVFLGDCMLLFKAMPRGWVMAWTTKLRKYTHVHNTAKLLQLKGHALPLNIQMSSSI